MIKIRASRWRLTVEAHAADAEPGLVGEHMHILAFGVANMGVCVCVCVSYLLQPRSRLRKELNYMYGNGLEMTTRACKYLHWHKSIGLEKKVRGNDMDLVHVQMLVFDWFLILSLVFV